jgi:hypothetical protein
MTGGQIEWARDEAERLAPPVRAAVLMRVARVLTASDSDAARELFDRALEEARSVPGRDGEALLEDARMYAAAVAPERVSEIPAGKHFPKRFLSDRVGKIMLEHGHFDAALQFVLHHEDAANFPFNLAHQLIDKLDGEKRLAVLRRTIDAWRQGHSGDSGPGRLNGFLHLFCGKWNLLPVEEARRVARELVDISLQEPDAPITAHYGSEPKLEITSWREHTLFQILHVLRVVDPELAQRLIETHAQLANAAQRWPNGFESMRQESEARRKLREGEGKKCGGWMMAGSPDSFPYLRALQQASGDGDFSPAFEFAFAKYTEDTAPANPNQALKASWPSSCMYCSVLYQAGRRLGDAGSSYLEQIADPDQRLLARIELAAAVAGLPEFQQTERRFFPQGNRQRRG